MIRWLRRTGGRRISRECTDKGGGGDSCKLTLLRTGVGERADKHDKVSAISATRTLLRKRETQWPSFFYLLTRTFNSSYRRQFTLCLRFRELDWRVNLESVNPNVSQCLFVDLFINSTYGTAYSAPSVLSFSFPHGSLVRHVSPERGSHVLLLLIGPGLGSCTPLAL